jgi:hypothetical protein
MMIISRLEAVNAAAAAAAAAPLGVVPGPGARINKFKRQN